MRDDYLWDRSGEPDMEIERLEKLLGPLRFAPKDGRAITPVTLIRHRWIAVAAALILIASTAVAIFRWKNRAPAASSGWQLYTGGHRDSLRPGQTVETSASDVARLESGSVGSIKLDGGSRLRLLSSRPDQQHFALDRGLLHAFLWAPPAAVTVDTPSAKAIDLGCQYTLSVASDGSGFVTVETGWVAFQAGAIEAFIPAGASCRTRRRGGPGTPYFLDAPRPFIQALLNFDTSGDWNSLHAALPLARSRDALTLWHLLSRTESSHRVEIYRRLATLVPLPPAANMQAVVRGDRDATDAAWDALDLGSTAWWRTWKRHW